MVDRIKQVMEYYKETPAGFSEAIGISRSNLAHLFSGRNQPSLDCAKKVLNAYPEISTEWLIMGVGPMIKNPSEVVVQKPLLTQPDLFAGFNDDVPASQGRVAEPVKPLEPSTPTVTTEMDETNTSDAKNANFEQKASLETDLFEQNEGEDAEEKETEQNIPIQNQPQIEIKPVENKQIRQRRQSNSTSSESKNQHRSVQGQGISDSRSVQFDNEKRITKIIFFFDDDSFKIYHP